MEPGYKQGEVVNMTRAIEALSPWLNNPRRTIVQVEALVVVVAVLLLLQLIVGYCKRRWHNSGVKFVLLVCNSIMFPLIIYTLSMMQSSPIKNTSYPIWAVFLIIASDGTVAVRQYDFYGSALKKCGEAVVEIGRYSFYMMMLLVLMTPLTWKKVWTNTHVMFLRPSTSCVRLLIGTVFMTKFLEGMMLLFWEDLDFFKTSYLAKRMQRWANDHPSDSDLESMEDNYLVQLPSVTIDKIWDCCGNSNDGKALKDISLSFALFLLLKRRYYGFACAEARFPKMHHFVFKKLLPSEGEYERVFRIVEVELGFCYDYFFTKYGFFYTLLESPIPLPFTFLALSGVKTILISAVGVFTFRKSLVLETPDPIIEVHSTSADYSITGLVVGVALIVQLLQVAFYLASDWVQVSLACMYVKKNCYGLNAFIGKVIGFLRRVTIPGRWANKIHQYSLFSGKLRTVDVSDAVRRAIARALISSDGILTNGEKSLTKNQNNLSINLSWTLKNDSQLQIMLIWHIATEYCALSEDHRNGITREDQRGVAVNLSKYSAYLIASVPELLPYHQVDIKEPLREVVEEEISEHRLTDIIGQFPCTGQFVCQRHPWSYEKLKSVDGTEEEDNPATVLKKGVKLGKQLESMPDGAQRWKVMEEFWAETLIYVAPSLHSTKQHMKHLENGGEFLTLIWALLSHAGILNLNRDKDQGPEAAETVV